MSSASKGGQRVGSVMTHLSRFGYRCARISASGQRRGARRTEKGLDGDIIALAPKDTMLPHLIIEAGGKSKSVAESLREMTEHPLPAGFIPIVARCVGRGIYAWRWHTKAHKNGHKTLLAAIDDAA